ncbi:hypothetical protein AB0F03_18440 [Streptomyces sp. NPDC028722]|uniref:hypothetical protein n=1 Tax=unclassified Streptomyces TaxID=2593676 RepID=UPI0033E37153
MRFAPIAAASALALGVLLGGFTVSSAAAAPGTSQQRTVAFVSPADVTASGTDNNGNG